MGWTGHWALGTGSWRCVVVVAAFVSAAAAAGVRPVVHRFIGGLQRANGRAALPRCTPKPAFSSVHPPARDLPKPSVRLAGFPWGANKARYPLACACACTGTGTVVAETPNCTSNSSLLLAFALALAAPAPRSLLPSPDLRGVPLLGSLCASSSDQPLRLPIYAIARQASLSASAFLPRRRFTALRRSVATANSMMNDQDYLGRQNMAGIDVGRTVSSTSPPATTSEEDAVADLDEPPEPSRTPRPAPLILQHSSFAKSKPAVDRKESLLTSALKSSSSTGSPTDDRSDTSPARGMSCVSTWSNNSCTTAELTSDGGFTSPGTRPSTPSPPPPSAMFPSMAPTFNKKPFEFPISVRLHDDDIVEPIQHAALPNPEQKVEAVLGRKRCIMFACGQKEDKKASEAAKKPTPAPPSEDPPKRACTIKFACPTKISTEAPSKDVTPRARIVSPPPLARRKPTSPKFPPKVHRDSDSTVRNTSPVSVRKASVVDRTRRLSSNSDLARCEAYRFHEFASSEEEIEEWTQEVTCHRSRLTVQDTLKVENDLRKLGEEVAEEEALEDDDDDDDEDAVDMDDDDDELLDEDDDNSDAYSDKTDEGFQTDDEEGFAVSDDESDAGSDYNWWAPGASTAATSVEHLEQLRLKVHRTVSESSIGSLESRDGHLKISDAPSKRRKSRPVNIRGPSPELPDSTDFVCGTLDEDRPAEAIYMATLERRRAAKHKPTPQDIDPTFPTSDPELPDDDEDEVSEVENLASESDFLHGRMDPPDADLRGRRKALPKKRSPLPSPKRFRSPPPTRRAVHRSPPPTKHVVHRSPPPPTKRSVHRSPPPRKLFATSPRRQHSPPPSTRLRSPPPTRRGSVNPMAIRQRSDMSIRFGGLAERPALMVSASVPRTPITMRNPFELDEDETNADDMPIRRAIDIQIGLEKKRQRRRERLYRKQHCKAVKEKRPAPGRGAERMREMGLAAHAHKGKTTAFGPFQIPTAADQQDMHVLSV
ncbi:hypothetical protein T440DRAFT_474165 [Plenodomus tracheiphilus IPT5]|uniref:Uncharacterized protein n=1 Tax=Plenodomus tracheiphilus IPT5 TaxID=1408161 RepID=A0A6A7BN07_9PLEO|nr:hypothetical protein T440DRAFT_474165 [Plenodomus tracheiphilus IPT5]